MSRKAMKRTRTGARVPNDRAGLSYLGQAIDEGTIVERQEASVGRMRGRILLTAIALFAERGYESCSMRSEEHTSELQSHLNLVCRLLLEKKNHSWLASLLRCAASLGLFAGT